MAQEFRFNMSAQRAFRKLDAITETEHLAVIAKIHGQNIINILRSATPVDPKPESPRRGLLKANWLLNVQPNRPKQGQLQIRVENLDSKAKKLLTFLRTGTRAHKIRARRAPFLVFRDSRTGNIIKRKEVYHPGTSPNAAIVKAYGRIPDMLNKLRSDLRKAVKDRVNRIQ